LIGTIHTIQRVLGRAQTPDEQLDALSLEELTDLAAELEKQAFEQR